MIQHLKWALFPILRYGVDCLKKWAGILILLIVLPFGGFLAANSINPVGSARWLLRGSELWEQKWPFARGKYAPFYLTDLLYDLHVLRPVQTQVQGFTLELDARDLVTQSLLLTGIWEPESSRLVQRLRRVECS